jgi:long-subunit fatty acid transport protein
MFIGAPSLHAQTSTLIPLQFDFLNPGAKSMALAGAFSGVADDATASFANPAGLIFLGGPEVSAELRGFRLATPYLRAGRLSGEVTNIGVDTIAGPAFADSVGTHVGLGYFSLVYPSPSRRWVVAAYRHELARVDQGFEYAGAFQQDPAELTSRRDGPQHVDRAISITGYGAAGAYKVTPSISIGAGLALYRFDIDSTVERYFPDGFYGPVDPQAVALSSTLRGRDAGLAPIAGATLDRGRTRFGVVYRHGATLHYDVIGDDRQSLNARFRVPHTVAFGVSTRTPRGLMVSGEVTYVTYSRLKDDFVSIQARGEEASLQVRNGTEVHGSVQYPLSRRSGPPVRLRAGMWWDPDHSVKFKAAEAPVTVKDRLFDELNAVALSKGSGQVHVTAGVGLTLTPRVELNAAVDLSSRLRLASTSFILHLGSVPP